MALFQSRRVVSYCFLQDEPASRVGPNNSFKPNPLRGFALTAAIPPFPLNDFWRVGLIPVLDDMSYDLRYCSSRAEIWRLYWSTWRSKLWIIHLFIAATIALPVANAIGKPINLPVYLLTLAVVLPVVIIFFAAWPQVAFKSKERALRVGPDGWSTQIGSISGSRTWSEITSVKENPESLVITSKSGNALVVPLRALPDQSSWLQFVRDAQTWHQRHVV